MTAYTFSQLIDFTRTSAATYVDASGRIVPTAASRNLLTFTQEFDNAAWTKVAATVTANAATAPDGTLTADTLVESAAAGVHYVSETVTGTAVGTTYTASVYAKPNGRNWIILEMSGATIYASFNVATGAVGTTSGSPTTTITPVGNGWYRCSMTKAIGAGISAIRVYTASADNTTSYTGDGTSGVFIWGAQLEAVPDANLVLGSELVTNGDFSSATGWTVGSGWSVSGGQATNSGTIGAISQSPLTAGKTYLLEFDLVAVSNWLVAAIGGAGNISFNTTGRKRMIATAGSTQLRFDTQVAGHTATIDNISVKEITGTTGMPTDYTRNVGGVFPPRFDYDPVTLAPRGLLVEEQRTNLLLRSEEFDNASWSKTNGGVATAPVVTANASTAPSGTTSADRAQFALNGGTTASDLSDLVQSVTVSAGSVTLSVWLRSNTSGDQTILVLGEGAQRATWTVTPVWQRFSVTYTSSGGTGNFGLRLRGTVTPDAADILVWGFQVEAGSFATSYIPTVASQVTRTADVATITGANFSQWYNQAAGTFVVEGDYVANVNWRRFMTVDDTAAPANNRIIINGDQNQQLLVTTSGVNQASLNAGTSPAANTVTRIASAYALDNFAAVRDGGTVAADTSGTVPTVNRLNIGLHPNGGEYLNGHIRSVRFYPTRLSNAQLQALTA